MSAAVRAHQQVQRPAEGFGVQRKGLLAATVDVAAGQEDAGHGKRSMSYLIAACRAILAVHCIIIPSSKKLPIAYTQST
jgi:hypothetical protein